MRYLYIKLNTLIKISRNPANNCKMKSIKNFSEIRLKDVPLVGGKNASLGEMFSPLSSKDINITFESNKFYYDFYHKF